MVKIKEILTIQKNIESISVIELFLKNRLIK